VHGCSLLPARRACPSVTRSETTWEEGGPKEALDAAFVKMSELPKKLPAGEYFPVSITMRNTGSQAWGPEIPKHSVLRSMAPADNTTWGTHFIIQGQGTVCKPGAEFTYRSRLRAPGKPGEYVFQWTVAHMDRGHYAGPATPFGQPTPRAVIQVAPRPKPTPATAPAPREADGKRVLRFEDFAYAGSFRVPGRKGQDMPFSHSGLALRKVADGTKRMFFNYTLPGGIPLASGAIRGSCFAPDSDLLYLYGPVSKGCIHAFGVVDP